MVSEALKRQGSVTHLWDGLACATKCRSKIGSSTVHATKVTCPDCLEGRRAADTVTGPYGISKGQMNLLERLKP